MNRLVTNLLAIAIVSAAAGEVFAGKSYHGDMSEGYHGGMSAHHGVHMMMGTHDLDFDQIRDNVSLDENQLALLAQLESSHYDLINMITNLRANSIGSDGEFDRDIYIAQLAENELFLENHQNLMMAFADTLTDEQRQQWASSKRSCSNHDKTY